MQQLSFAVIVAATITQLEERDKKIEQLSKTVEELNRLVTGGMQYVHVTCSGCNRELGPEDNLDDFKCPQCGAKSYSEQPIDKLIVSRNKQN